VIVLAMACGANRLVVGLRHSLGALDDLGHPRPGGVGYGNRGFTVTAALPNEEAFMRFYETSARIAAKPDEVWAVLSDAATWPAWDSGVAGVEGRVAPGEKVRVRSAVGPGRAFPVTVTEFDPPHRFTFSGGMPLGLFRGVRTYTLTPDGDGTTFTMREDYSGPMLGLIWRSMPDLQPSFDQFAAGLKRRVESGA
jgi:hypothetical protein